MIVAQGYTLRFIAIGKEGDKGGRLGCWLQVAPVVNGGFSEVDGSYLLTICCENIAAYQTKGQGLHLRCHLKHIVNLHHLVATHGGKQADDIGAIGSYNEVVALLRGTLICCHVLLMQLFLIGNGDDDVTIAFLYFAWCVCLPKGFVLF